MIKKGLAVAVILLFFSVGVIPSTGINSSITGRKTIYVDDDNTQGPWDGTIEHPYQRIRDGIVNSSTGDTVYVFSGTYYENVDITKEISLIGEDKYTTVIDGQKKGNVVKFPVGGSYLSGFTVRNSKDWANDAGINIHSHHNTVTGNIITENNAYSFYVFEGDHTTITNNIIVNNSKSIYLRGRCDYDTFSGNTVINDGLHLGGRPQNIVISNNHFNNGGISQKWGSENTISGNTLEKGSITLTETPYNSVNNNIISSGSINIESSSHNTIKNNDLEDSKGITITGDSLDHWNNHIIESNTVNGNPLYYYKNSDNIFIPSDAGQVILANCNYFEIKDLTISGVGDGLQLGFSSHNTISGSIIKDNYGDGIRLYDSSNNIIRDNTITNNSDIGISITKGDNNTVSGNDITNNKADGIQLIGSFNKIFNNVLTDNGKYGIQISNGLSNEVYANAIKNNKNGICLITSSNNHVYRNNFIGNSGIHAYFRAENLMQSNNKWNRNYWGTRGGFLIKPVLGTIKTRFYYDDMYGNRIYIYRPGFNFDLFPRLLPYIIPIEG